MKLQFVSHCWRYSRLLTYQLSSLWLYPPQTTDVLMTVFCGPRSQDPETWQTLEFFASQPAPARVLIDWHELEPERLFRRAIGRNLAALSTTADWIWFTDCDMLFRRGACDALEAAVSGVDADLVYPAKIRIHQTHTLGDDAVRRVEHLQLYDIDESEFIPRRYTRAIGGVQIVRGTVARAIGYCNGTRWQNPAPSWQRCRDDKVFRKILQTPGTSVSIPQVYRIRHSKRGADQPDVRN